MSGLPWVDLALAALAAIGTLGAAIAWLRAREERRAGANETALTAERRETDRDAIRDQIEADNRRLTRDDIERKLRRSGGGRG